MGLKDETKATEETPNPSFDRVLRWVGDLDHPFYKDERHRYVWYEASAIGFQMLLLLQFVVGGLAMLVFGRDALLYMLVGMLPVVITSYVVMIYTNQRGAQYFAQSSDLRRSRAMVAMGIVLVWVAGLVRVGLELPSDGGETGFDRGLLVGAIVGLASGVGAAVWAKRRHRLAEAAASLELDD